MLKSQRFYNLASDWLAAQPPTNRKRCEKFLVNWHEFFSVNQSWGEENIWPAFSFCTNRFTVDLHDISNIDPFYAVIFNEYWLSFQIIAHLWNNAVHQHSIPWKRNNLLVSHKYHGYYRKASYISRTLVGNKIVHNSDVVGASPVGAAPTTSSFSIYHLASTDWAKTTARRD